MRLTTVILLGTMLHLSAATFGQKLNYVNKNVSLEQLFKEIKKQTNYNVVWYEGKLNTDRTINANFSNASLDQVMDKALSGLPLTYTIRQNNIVIKEKTPSLLDKVISHFKNTTLFGKVTDEKGNPLPGATIRIKDTKTAVLSNKDGNFSIESKETSGVLFISFLGYKPAEINFSPTNPGPFTISLKEDESILSEVQINAGYYSVSDRERTGNISKITAETIEKQPVNNVLQALQGRVPGLQITQQTGVPGGGFSVKIRGRSSINTNVSNDPLYIVDGVIYPSARISAGISNDILTPSGANPLSFINPYDIESIEILKDADATSIYGSRGANGVILITTKRSKEEKTTINTMISKGFSQVGHHLNLLNTQQYIDMRKEALKNDGLTTSETDYDINGAWDPNKYTDWQKKLIGGTANNTNVSLGISGGSEKGSYLLGGNYYKETTVFPGTFGFKRVSVHSNLNFGSLKDHFTVTFSANYSHTMSDLLQEDLTSFILLAPNAPDPYDQFGKLNWGNGTVYINPFSSLLKTSDANTDNLVGNLNLNYRFAKNFKFKTPIGYTSVKREEFAQSPLASYSPGYGYTASNRVSNFTNNYSNSIIVEPQLDYDIELGKGKLSSLIGTTFQSNKLGYRTIKASGFSSDELLGNISSANLLTATSNSSAEYRYTAIFARVNYNLEDKYILNLTARRDGSSRFGPDKRFANFGAAGLAWIFTEEKLIKDNFSFLNFGKLRVSYGVTGNDQITDYGYLQLWTNQGTYQGIPTLAPSRISNADFAWEVNKKSEAALQLSFFKDKFNLEASYYRNRSSNQLVEFPLALSTGNGSITRNLPAIVQNSGWEISGNLKFINNLNWKWTTGFNFTLPKNKLVSYPGGIENSPYSTLFIIGQPLTISKSYNVIGVDPQTGLYNIEDHDGNGSLDSPDRYISKFVGQKYYGGLQNTINYKQFSFDFLLTFSKQDGINYAANTYSPGFFDNTSPLVNQPSVVLQRWKNPGDQTSIQKFSSTFDAYISYVNANLVNSGSLSVTNASYMRLKNVSISYNLPKRILETLKVSNAKLSLQGQNLFTLTNFIGLDPESQSMLNVPPLRTLSININVAF